MQMCALALLGLGALSACSAGSDSADLAANTVSVEENLGISNGYYDAGEGVFLIPSSPEVYKHESRVRHEIAVADALSSILSDHPELRGIDPEFERIETGGSSQYDIDGLLVIFPQQ